MSRLTVQLACHERKHNARRTETGGCVSGIPTSAKSTAVKMCDEALLESAVRHRQVLVHRQAQGKQARDRRAEAALVGCLNVLKSSVGMEIEEAACNLPSTERSHLDGAIPVVPRAIVASHKCMQ